MSKRKSVGVVSALDRLDGMLKVKGSGGVVEKFISEGEVGVEVEEVKIEGIEVKVEVESTGDSLEKFSNEVLAEVELPEVEVVGEVGVVKEEAQVEEVVKVEKAEVAEAKVETFPPAGLVIEPPKLKIQSKETYEDRFTKRTYYLSWDTVRKIDDLSEKTGVPKSRILSAAMDFYLSAVEITSEDVE